MRRSNWISSGLVALAVGMLTAALACGGGETLTVVVEKEVIKEVPVERIVEKEVIKEVPVERIRGEDRRREGDDRGRAFVSGR